LGTVPLGTHVSREASFAMLDGYVASGGNFIDTAHVYSDWFSSERHMSEKTIGQWLRARGWPKDVIVATKGGHPPVATKGGYSADAALLEPRLAPDQIAADLDESLHCLGVERIDLYYLHRDDPHRPVGEIMETLSSLQRQGKLRYFACSNWHPARIQAAHDYAQSHGLQTFAMSQIFWSLAVPNPGAFASDHIQMDDAAERFYAAANIPVCAFTSQARGFFTKAATAGLDAIKPERRRDFENAMTLARLARAKEVAAQLGTTVTAIILAYIKSHAFVSIPIIGPHSLEQLHDSLLDADLMLLPETVRYLATGQ